MDKTKRSVIIAVPESPEVAGQLDNWARGTGTAFGHERSYSGDDVVVFDPQKDRAIVWRNFNIRARESAAPSGVEFLVALQDVETGEVDTEQAMSLAGPDNPTFSSPVGMLLDTFDQRYMRSSAVPSPDDASDDEVIEETVDEAPSSALSPEELADLAPSDDPAAAPQTTAPVEADTSAEEDSVVDESAESADAGDSDDVLYETADYDSDDPTRRAARELVDSLIPVNPVEGDETADMTISAPDDLDELSPSRRTLLESHIRNSNASIRYNQKTTLRNLASVSPREMSLFKQSLVDQIVDSIAQSDSGNDFSSYFEAEYARGAILEYMSRMVDHVVQQEEDARNDWMRRQMDILLDEYDEAHPSQVGIVQEKLRREYGEMLDTASTKAESARREVTDRLADLARERDSAEGDVAAAVMSLGAMIRESQETVNTLAEDFRRETQEEREREEAFTALRDKMYADMRAHRESAAHAAESEDAPTGKHAIVDDEPAGSHALTSSDYDGADDDEAPSTASRVADGDAAIADDDSAPIDHEDDGEGGHGMFTVGSADPAQDDFADAARDDYDDPDHELSDWNDASELDDLDDFDDEEGGEIDDGGEVESPDDYDTIDDLSELDGSGEDGGEAHADKKASQRKKVLGYSVGCGATAIVGAVLIGGLVWPGFFTGNDADDSDSPSAPGASAEQQKPDGQEQDASGLYRVGDSLSVVVNGTVTQVKITEFIPAGGAIGYTSGGDQVTVTQNQLDRYAERHPDDFADRRTSDNEESLLDDEREDNAGAPDSQQDVPADQQNPDGEASAPEGGEQSADAPAE